MVNWRNADEKMPKIPKGKNSIKVAAIVTSGEYPDDETWLTIATLYEDGAIFDRSGRVKLVKWTTLANIGFDNEIRS